MNRNDFLKKVGIGALIASGTPQILSAVPDKKTRKEKVRVAIDFHSINSFKFGGRSILAFEILNHFDKTGILIYDSKKGKEPIVFEGQIKTIKI